MCSGDTSISRPGGGRSPRGSLLGIAQLSKFSMLLLYAVWPFLWLVRLVLVGPRTEGDRARRAPCGTSRGASIHGVAIVALSILTIDVGYFFEGVGIPLGEFEFGSRTLTRPVPPGTVAAAQREPAARRGLAVPRQSLPRDLAGPPADAVARALSPGLRRAEDRDRRDPAPILRARIRDRQGRRGAADAGDRPASRDGGLFRLPQRRAPRDRAGGTTTCCALVYKVPEGTWLLVALSLVALGAWRSGRRTEWFDEIALWTVPVVILFSMSFLTDINLGLRYVLAILPYVFISTGKVVPWCMGRSGAVASRRGIDRRRVARADDRGLALDSPALSRLFQLGLGRPGSRAGAADRQQPRLGPGPGRAPAVVEGEHPRPADRPGVFRADQPVDLRDAGRAVPLVPAAGPARDGRSDARGRRAPG